MSDQTEKTDIKALIELCPTGTSLNYKLLLKNAPVLFIKCLIARLHPDRSNATFLKILCVKHFLLH